MDAFIGLHSRGRLPASVNLFAVGGGDERQSAAYVNIMSMVWMDSFEGVMDNDDSKVIIDNRDSLEKHQSREVSPKRNIQYGWPPYTNFFSSTKLKLKILYTILQNKLP